VELLVGSQILRLYAQAEGGIYPESFKKTLHEMTPRFDAWAEAIKQSDAVKAGIWNEETFLTKLKARIEKAKSKA
jgi:hypothetical protein